VCVCVRVCASASKCVIQSDETPFMSTKQCENFYRIYLAQSHAFPVESCVAYIRRLPVRPSCYTVSPCRMISHGILPWRVNHATHTLWAAANILTVLLPFIRSRERILRWGVHHATHTLWAAANILTVLLPFIRSRERILRHREGTGPSWLCATQGRLSE